MAEAKIQFTLGPISFSGEGDEAWVGAQLDKVLEKAPSLAGLAAELSSGSHDDSGSAQKGPKGTLASFITSVAASGNQVKRFLATAVWLHGRGKKRLTTRDVATALQENNQKRLSNPADCLGKNVAKGYCEKVGNEFYVTDEGRASLGGNAG